MMGLSMCWIARTFEVLCACGRSEVLMRFLRLRYADLQVDGFAERNRV